MNIELSCQENENKVTFMVTFVNLTDSVESIPLDYLKLNAERVNVRICAGGVRLEPIEYDLVNSAKTLTELQLSPKQSHSIEINGRIEKKAEKVFALVFHRATYKIDLEKDYTVDFYLGGVRSNTITCKFDWNAMA